MSYVPKGGVEKKKVPRGFICIREGLVIYIC